ncbi:hypothetical protein DL765_007634 [Monosporascus sp. GIB2]|nr:hypothetical protein DL765_007634 [Monosporascus sp. GIB2]
MTFSQREASPDIAALEAYGVQWMEEMNRIKSQYYDQKDSELSIFQNERERIQSEIQILQERLKDLECAYENAAKERARDYQRRLEAHLKSPSLYMKDVLPSPTKAQDGARQPAEELTQQSGLENPPTPLRGLRGRRQAAKARYAELSPQNTNPTQSKRARRPEHALASSQHYSRRMTRKRGKLEIVNQRQHKLSESIIDPTVGNVYRAYWKPSETWYAAVVLPAGDFDSIEMSGSITDTGLLKYIPVCYCFDKQTRQITGWQKGYETGGSHATKRKFPVMYFDDALTIPLSGDFRIPQRDLFDWVPAKSLKPFDFKDLESSLIPGYKSACDFRARLEARRKQQPQPGSMLIDGGDGTRDGQSTELTSSSSNDSRHIQQPNTEAIPRDKTRSMSAEPRAAQAVATASMEREMVDIHAILDNNDESHTGSETHSLRIEDSSLPDEGQRTGVVQLIGNRGLDQGVNANCRAAGGACPDTADTEALEQTQQASEPIQGFSASARTSQNSTASEAGLIERQPTLRRADGPKSSLGSRSNEDGEGHYSNTCDDVTPQREIVPSNSAADIRASASEIVRKTPGSHGHQGSSTNTAKTLDPNLGEIARTVLCLQASPDSHNSSIPVDMQKRVSTQKSSLDYILGDNN